MELTRAVEQAQSAYARWLAAGTWLSIALLTFGFFAYVTGALPAHVPLDRLPQLWGMPVRSYLEAAHAPTGWGWVALAGRGDYFNYFGIVLLCSITAVCYLRILPFLLARERIYAYIAAAQIIVLLVAGSGLLNSCAGGTP